MRRSLEVRILSISVGALSLAACTSAPAGSAAPAASLSPANVASSNVAPPTTPAATDTFVAPPPPTPPAEPDRGGLDGLADATLDLPGWETPACLPGPTRFSNGRAGFMRINFVGQTDVDRDGSTDVVALVGCAPGEGHGNQAIAFHRRADGTVITIGRIVAADENAMGPGDTIQNVGDVLHLHADGTVGVDVGNYETTFTSYAEIGVWETRDYRWDGHRFVQAAGPTSFHVPDSVQLSASASPMHFDKPVGGYRTGSITVRIANLGTSPVAHVSVRLVLEGPVKVGSGCTRLDDIAETCGDYSIPAAGHVTVTLPIRIQVSMVNELLTYFPIDESSVVQVRVNGLRSVDQTGLGAATFA